MSQRKATIMSAEQFADQGDYASLEREMATPDAADELIGTGSDDSGASQQPQAQPEAAHYRQAQPQPQAYGGEEQQDAQHGLPDVEADPIGHFGARMQGLETAAGNEIFWHRVQVAETAAREAFSDYDAACEHLEDGRKAELARAYPDTPEVAHAARQMGFQSPAQLRAAMLNRDRIAIAQQAIRLGMNPGHLYYQLAQQRGFKSTRGPNKVETKFMVKLADEDPERFDRAWDLMAKAGHL